MPSPHEPRPQVKAPKFPRWMDDDAKAIWRRMCRALLDMRVLTELDEAALAAYCVLYSRWMKAEAGLKQSGLIVKDARGRPMRSPFTKIANDCVKQLIRISSEFGLTPACRGRIHAMPPVEIPEDSAEAGDAAARHARLFGRKNT